MDKGYKIDLIKSNQKDVINGLHSQIEQRIQGYNVSLTTSFKDQEDKLLSHYKIELQKAKKTLALLEESSKESELKKRTDEKQQQLKLEKEKVLQESHLYNNKYNEWKQNQSQVNSLRFLNLNKEKMFRANFNSLIHNQANRVNEKLQFERQALIEQIKAYDPNFQIDEESNVWNTFNQSQENTKILSNSIESQILNQSKIDYISPYSYRKLDQNNSNKTKISIQSQEKKTNLKKQLEYLSQDKNLSLQDFEVLFVDSVNEFKELKKKNQFPKITNSDHIKQNEIFVEEEFNDHEKKQMIEFFLSKIETKKHIYKLLNEN